MTLNQSRVREHLKNFEFENLFVEELGWDRLRRQPLVISLDADEFTLETIAEKRGMVAFLCDTKNVGAGTPDYRVRRKIENQVRRTAHEHLIIYVDRARQAQIWQWVRREPGRPAACREHTYQAGQPGDALVQKLEAISFSLEEEEALSIATVAGRARRAFDVERVTKRFYDRFQTEHGVFLSFIQGIQTQGDREWYCSLMLNRLMFVYFVQKKGFLDGDSDYLRNRLRLMQTHKGKDSFHSFYRHFLLRLFHDGLGRDERTSELDTLLGRVPYLNGGLFDVHELERANASIEIADEAFEKIFDFFDAYQWHLDARPLRSDNEINPDVLGYIFEKYINQKQMGAYYTKEDITEYIGKNTVVPFLLDSTRTECRVAFENPGGPTVWDLLKSDPDRYMYPVGRHGNDLSVPAEIGAPVDPSNSRRSSGGGSARIEQSANWNKSAPSAFALPTETWLEVFARRSRYKEIFAKIASGDVHEIDDLVALNLDLRQFAQDTIENCEGPELLRAFWQSMGKVTILDPTCGSGAFLFATLNILEPLYEACLDRMEAFVEDVDSDRTTDKRGPEQFADFRQILGLVASHPNRPYFICKSIILNNLFGVDIMEEAVEICKLRLFLKLAAQVEPDANHDNFGIEPLPDIDFNIKAGNSLVGFATYDDARRIVTSKLDFDNAMEEIADRAVQLQNAFDSFRERQIRANGSIPKADKLDLRTQLAGLQDVLNRYIGVDYGINLSDKKAFAQWLMSCQPFHWFVEFYGIMKDGGFDVIIGNPPYVEYRNISEYKVHGYRTESCGDLYAFMLERSLALAAKGCRVGFIVPMSCFAVDRFAPLQDLFFERTNPLFITNWSGDAHPSRLFEGVDKRLEIVLARTHDAKPQALTVYSSRDIKWYAEERPTLFRTAPVYQKLGSAKDLMVFPASVPKVGSGIELEILNLLRQRKRKIGLLATRNGTHPLYYTRKVSFFLQFLNFVPRVFDSLGVSREPSELKTLQFHEEAMRNLCLACLSSSLFYWYNIINSDCRNLNKREIISFPVPDEVSISDLSKLVELISETMQCYEDNSTMRTVHYARTGDLTVQYFNFRPAKFLIDQLDAVLLPLYGFTDSQQDFIVNYDIKYRMGSGDDGYEA